MHSLQLAFDRCKAAMQAMGFSVEPGSWMHGELMGYAAGLGCISRQFDHILQEVFVQTAQDYGLSMQVQLLQEQAGQNKEAIRQTVIDRYSSVYGGFTRCAFETALYALGDSVHYTLQDGAVKVSGMDNDPETLTAFGRFLTVYVTPFLRVCMDGMGLTWDALEAKGLTYDRFDRADCPFSILDTMKETNE